MAKQKGIIKIVGSLDGLTFYRTRGGYIVRKKSSLTKERVDTDPAFSKTRENNQEFAQAVRASKLMRDAMRPLLVHASDSRIANRLIQVFMRVKNEDILSARGSRNVANGLSTPTGKALLRDFEFNRSAVLSSILHSSYTVDSVTGSISFTHLDPRLDIVFPSSATHVALTAGFLGIDFNDGLYDLHISAPTILSSTSPAGPLTLTPSTAPSVQAPHFFFLQLCYYQDINGTLYMLADKGHNTLTIVEVS